MAEKNKLKLNPYKDRTTQEGEFGFFSPGTDRGWRLVKDDKDPRKRVWHLVDKDGRVLDKKKGALTIGGNLSEWAQGGFRNTANWFANLSIQKQIEYQEMIDKGYTPVRSGRSGLKWVKKETTKPKIDSVSEVADSNSFDQTNQSVDTGSSVDGQPSEIDGVEVQNLSLKNQVKINPDNNNIHKSIKKLQAPGGPPSSEILTKPKPWARQWAGGDGTTLKDANTKTVNWLKQEGYDVSAIPKHKLKNLLADVRLDRAFFTSGTKGDFLHHDGHIIKRKPKKSNKNK